MTERLHGTDNLGDAEDRKCGGPDLGHFTSVEETHTYMKIPGYDYQTAYSRG